MARTEETYNMAWHTANLDGNANYIGYEVCESMSASDKDFLANEDAVLKQAAEDLKYYGLPANRSTVRLHKEFSSTSCPHRSSALHGQSVDAVKDYFISRINMYMNGKTPETPKPPVKPTPNNKFNGVNTAGAQFKLNDTITMAGHATFYQPGQPISPAARGKKYTVYNTKAHKQANSEYAYLIGINNVATGWLLQQDIVGGKTTSSVKPTTPTKTNGKWEEYAESGTFIPNTKVAIKPEPTKASTEIDVYNSGQRINYDRVAINEGLTWISYISYSGARRYVSIREVAKPIWGQIV